MTIILTPGEVTGCFVCVAMTFGVVAWHIGYAFGLRDREIEYLRERFSNKQPEDGIQ